MPRIPPSTEPSKVYVGMLIVTCLAMLVGITALILDSSDYDWVQKPQAVVAPALPQERKEETKSGSLALPKPFEAAKVEPPAPAAIPALVMPAPLPPIAVAVEPPKPVESPATAAPLTGGPIPSPLTIPRR